MRLRKQIAVIAAALAATTSLVWGQERPAPESANSGKTIVGTWRVLRHGANCATGERLGPNFHALITFNRGGTLNAYAVAPGETPAQTSPEYGIWSRVQDTQTYIFRDVSYGYDQNGAFTGRGELTATVTLDADGDSFTQDTIIDVYGANGNFLFSFCGKATGRRFK